MPIVNNMTRLLNKTERRLGTKMLNLPDKFSKDIWASEVIANETIDTFSRYFPYSMPYMLTPDNMIGPNRWIIDEKVAESQRILGGGDIDWHTFSSMSSVFGGAGGVYAPMDALVSGFNFEDIAMQQMMADHSSIFKTGIYLDYKEPNMLQLNTTFSNANLSIMQKIPITLFVNHSTNLMTIPGTKMETFEQLAQADIASFLYEGLKYFDNVETVFANTEMKLSDLQDKANKRDEVVNELKEGFVSAANKVMPMIMAV